MAETTYSVVEVEGAMLVTFPGTDAPFAEPVRCAFRQGGLALTGGSGCRLFLPGIPSDVVDRIRGDGQVWLASVNPEGEAVWSALAELDDDPH